VKVVEILDVVHQRDDSSVLPRRFTQRTVLVAEKKTSSLKDYIDRMRKVISNELWKKLDRPTEETDVKQCLDQKKED